MKGIPPTTIPQDGMTVLNVDLREMVSNVVTAYCAGNQRSVWRAVVPTADILFLLDLAITPPDKWLPFELEAALDPKSRYKQVPIEVSHVITGLFQRPRSSVSYGSSLTADLLGQADMWGDEYVALPAFGYARRRLRLLANTDMTRGFSGSVSYTRVPSPCSKWNRAIAFLCIMADMTRWSEGLLPTMESSQVGGHPYKDQPYGAMMAFDKQLKMIWSLASLYRIQGSLIVAHANRRLTEKAAQLRMGIDLRSKPALLAREEAIAPIYDIRLHPLASVICRALMTGTVKTYHGEKDILYCHGKIDTNSDGDEDIGEAIVKDALEEFGKEKSDRWGDCIAKGSEPISLSTLSRQALSLGEFHKSWGELATKLGWSDISMNVGVVTQENADFILCDGTYYSHEPAAGLLGLIPVLSLGNIKVGGYNRRFAANFGLAADRSVAFAYCPMVVDGFQSATGSAASYERLYIPSGMSMGESGTEQFLADAITSDPLIGEVVQHFVAKSATYVEQHYTDPAGENVPDFTPTDWDGFATADTLLDANTRLSLGYVGQTLSAKSSRYMYKDRFFHRFPVKRAREDVIRWFLATGVYDRDLVQDGNVSFSPSEMTQHTSADLEKLVSSASVAPAGTTAVLPQIADQVKEG